MMSPREEHFLPPLQKVHRESEQDLEPEESAHLRLAPSLPTDPEGPSASTQRCVCRVREWGQGLAFTAS